MERTRPRSPRFLQRSRSGTARLCHVCPAPESSPALSLNLPRSRSAAKTRPDADSLVRKPKENRESPSPRHHPSPTPRFGGNARQPRPPPVSPSAWALSPGRLPAKVVDTSAKVAERQRRGGVLGLFRRRKEPSAREQAAHQLKLLTVRLLQWRFVNARAVAATAAARSNAEKKLFHAWCGIYDLRNIVAAKRILIQRRKHKMKLVRILRPQIQLLNQWESTAKRNVEAVSALGRVLGTVCFSLPLVEGAQANIVSIHKHICLAMDIMKNIEAAIRIFYCKVEKMIFLLNELVTTVRLEMEGLDKVINGSKEVVVLEIHEMSLRANVIQAMNELSAPVHLSNIIF